MPDFKTRLARLGGHALYYYGRLFSLTARWESEGRANLTLARATGRPILWSLWHGQLYPFLGYLDRTEDATRYCMITVGGDYRTDVLAAIAERRGAQTFAVDMQGNPVAAGRTVLRAVQAMRRGHDSLILPDGPDGPAYEPKPGVVMLARKSNAVILPAGVWTRQAYRLRRWDHYQVPFPFARLKIHIGRPIFAEEFENDEALLAEIAAGLHQARRRAQLMAGVEPWL